LSKHTVTGLISTSGRQFQDWSADYRFFSKERFDPNRLFDVVRTGILDGLEADSPFLVAMDDTISRKKGREIPGTAWRRDPMSPAFQANLVWGRRFIQASALISPDSSEGPSRAIPIDFTHAPTPTKPKMKASSQEWAHYRQEARNRSLSQQGVDRLKDLRRKISDDGEPNRPLWVTVDGSYTNKTVLKQLPENTTLIGRIRHDACLHPKHNPQKHPAKGRSRLYGVEKIRPKQVLEDPNIEWQTVQIYAAGRIHNMRYKTVTPLLWRTAGADRPLRLVVIAPLAYRLNKSSRILYRRPAFLICTDPDLPPDEVLKAYVQRWDIEVNFRDEKQLLGFDQAQVRNPSSACVAPKLAVAAYSFLLLAATRVFGVNGAPSALPQPKWREKTKKPRASTMDFINHLRFELWGRAIGSSCFSGFVNTGSQTQKPENHRPDLASSVFYAQTGG
jgi:hypothetical protein